MYYDYPYSTVYRNQNIEKEKIIKVMGEGAVTATPNVVSATFGVISEGKDLNTVQNENSETISRIISVLTSFQVPSKSVQTFDYQVTSEYDYIDGKQVFRGYRVQTLLKVMINHVNQLGQIINRVIEAGANYVSNVQFKVLEPEQFNLLALKEALRNAHEKAETIVNELKVKWNSTPLRVEEVKRSFGLIEPQMTFVKGASTEQFQPGILRFSAEVLVKYRYT
ncbi:SIMPL domain-containing protein [Pseudoneobacillus sp. C159]